jgi:hypothetical protein
LRSLTATLRDFQTAHPDFEDSSATTAASSRSI